MPWCRQKFPLRRLSAGRKRKKAAKPDAKSGSLCRPAPYWCVHNREQERNHEHACHTYRRTCSTASGHPCCCTGICRKPPPSVPSGLQRYPGRRTVLLSPGADRDRTVHDSLPFSSRHDGCRWYASVNPDPDFTSSCKPAGHCSTHSTQHIYCLPALFASSHRNVAHLPYSVWGKAVPFPLIFFVSLHEANCFSRWQKSGAVRVPGPGHRTGGQRSCSPQGKLLSNIADNSGYFYSWPSVEEQDSS